jgi:hypothetical protein
MNKKFTGQCEHGTPIGQKCSECKRKRDCLFDEKLMRFKKEMMDALTVAATMSKEMKKEESVVGFVKRQIKMKEKKMKT